MRTRVQAARVACATCYLQVNPAMLRNYTSITKSQFNLKSGYGVQFIASNIITLRDSFTVQPGATFTAIVNGTGLPKRAGGQTSSAPQNSSPPLSDKQYTGTALGETRAAMLSITTRGGRYVLACKIIPNEPLIVAVYTLNGRLVLQSRRSPQESHTISLGSLQHGSYVLRVQSGREVTFRKIFLTF